MAIFLVSCFSRTTIALIFKNLKKKIPNFACGIKTLGNEMNIAKPSFEKSAYPVEEMRFQQDLKGGRGYVFNRFRYRWGEGGGWWYHYYIDKIL